MKSSFNFFSETAKWIEGILKTVFEFAFARVHSFPGSLIPPLLFISPFLKMALPQEN